VVNLDRGRKLGPYEILEPIGAGGMGEIYKARDTRLQRLAALKVQPIADAVGVVFRVGNDMWDFRVRPNGAEHQWGKDPPKEVVG